MSDSLFWLVVGYMFAPAIVVLILFPVGAAMSVWRWLFPPPPSPSFPDLPPHDPPPPLSDAEYHRLINVARLMRRRQKRGLV